MTGFVDKLKTAQEANDSWVCVGLDPVLERMPAPVLKQDEPFLPFLKAVVDATADVVCAFKPNLGFYLAMGAAGVIALERIIAYIPDDIPVILDAKFNDIGHTAQAYARGAFEALGVDAVTVNPYLGQDGVAPFLGAADKAAFVLARTSNQSAGEFQDLRVRSQSTLAQAYAADETEPPALFQTVVERAQSWNEGFPGACGLVVGATYPEELAQVRAIAPDLLFLIPGIGAQGGNLEAAVRYGPTLAGLGPIINTSRGVLYASAGEDFGDAARAAAGALRSQINRMRESAESS
jgi:orotidine-5'-phosphate decarboxylase